MRIVKMVKFDKDDSQVLNRIVELCNMAASFFLDDRLGETEAPESGLKAITRLRAGHPLEARHIAEASMEVDKAVMRVAQARVGPCFPEELKVRYTDNLLIVSGVLKRWKEAANEEEVQIDAGLVP